MATNIGPKIGVEGAAEYRKQINQIIAQAKELDSEMKLVTSSFNKDTTAEEKNAKVKKVLTKQIENQKQRVELLKKQLAETTKKYGENDARTIKLRTSLNNANTALNKMTNELNDVEREMAEAAKETQQTTARMDGFGDATDKAGNKSGAFTTGLKKVGGALGKTIATAAAAATTALLAVGSAMVKASVNAAKYADEILTLSQTTLLSTDKLQEFQYAAELIDVDLETITGALTRNIRSMKQASDGTGEAADAYKQLGVDVLDAEGNFRDGESVFWDVVDALGKMENETERDALAMSILGKSAQELNPLFNIGSQGFAEYAKEAHDMGAVLDKDALTSLGGLDDSLQRLRQSGSAAKNVIGAILAPALTNLADKATEAMASFTKTTSKDGLAAGIKDLSKNISGIVADITKELPNILQAGISIVIALAEGIAQALPDLLMAIVTLLTDPAIYEGILNAAFLLVNSLLEGLTQALPVLIQALPMLVTTIVTTICAPENLTKMIGAALDLVMALYDGITTAIPQLIECVPQIITSLVTALTEPATLTKLILAMPHIIMAMVTGLLNAIPAIIQAGIALVEQLKTAITSGDFKRWGQDMIQGIIDGIKGMIKRVGDAAKEVADKIRSFLHFSKPDEGPLREYQKWMPDFMEGLARGIDSNAWRVRDALNGLSGGMSMSVTPRFEPATGAMLAAAGSTTNVGGLTVNVYGTEGQSVDALADRVMDKINVTLQNSGRVWA